MGLPSSGPITLKQLQDEFGGTDPISLSEYYRNGGLVPSNNTGVPTSGAISIADFYGSVNEILVTVNTSSGSRVSVAGLFGANYSSSVPKRLVISSGVTLGSTNTGQGALLIDSGMGGTITVDNRGDIIGAAGSAGADGGPAVECDQTSGVSILNSGNIYAGGGGGGTGGTGGTGGGGYYSSTYWQNRGGGNYINCGQVYRGEGGCNTVLSRSCTQRYGNSARCSYGANNNTCGQCYDDQDSTPD